MPAHTASWLQHELGQGRYRISDLLGEGGMALVYRARDQLLERDVVIKVPRASVLEEPDFAARFQREVRALARLTHAHVLKVMDVGEHEGVPFLVLEYLAGGTLRNQQPLGANGQPRPLAPEGLRDWLPGIASALDYIHQQHYVHRDVKPDNVLFDAQGHVYLSDFGIAKVLGGDQRRGKQTVLTAANMVLGTAQYMAPELALGEAYDGRVDQYALAVTVYELLSGRVPVDGPTPVAILMKRTQEVVIPLREVVPGIPAALSKAVERGLARQAGERFADCGSFAGAVLAGLGESRRPASLPKPQTVADDAVPRANEPAKLQCPRCRAAVPVQPDDSVGRVTCRHCGEVLRVPGRELPAATRETPRAAARVVTQARPAPESAGRRPHVAGPAVPGWKWYASLGGGGLGVLLAVLAWLLSGEEPVALPPTPTKVDLTNSIGMPFVLIPAGKFLMGSPKTEEGRGSDEDEHEVEISKPFYLGVHEVTHEQYERVLGTNPAYFTKANGGGPNHPVEQVSHDDAVAFCRKLSDMERQHGRLYRLPTEAEWEYACRGGARSKTVFHYGNSLSPTQANFDGNFPYGGAAKGVYRGKTTPVGAFQPNVFGLYDMHGNVYEWCADWYDEKYYTTSPRVNPSGPSGGSFRLIRGGSWSSDGRICRAALRFRLVPAGRFQSLGFRLALVPATK